MGHGAELQWQYQRLRLQRLRGSRPAFLISSSLTVEAEDTNPLEQYTVRELAEELFRRIGN